MTLKVVIGDYAIDMTMKKEENNIIRIKSLYIDKISDMHKGMRLSEWLNKDQINELIRENIIECNDATTMVYSKQPRKRLRSFNIK